MLSPVETEFDTVMVDVTCSVTVVVRVMRVDAPDVCDVMAVEDIVQDTASAKMVVTSDGVTSDWKIEKSDGEIEKSVSVHYGHKGLEDRDDYATRGCARSRGRV